MSALSKAQDSDRSIDRVQTLAYELSALASALYDPISALAQGAKVDEGDVLMLASMTQRKAKKLAKHASNIFNGTATTAKRLEEEAIALRELARGLMGDEPFEAWKRACASAQQSAAPEGSEA